MILINLYICHTLYWLDFLYMTWWKRFSKIPPENICIVKILPPFFNQSFLSPQVCSGDKTDASCHHDKPVEPQVVVPPECVGQTTPCNCQPNTPCTCNPHCNAYNNGGAAAPSPSETLALSTPVQKPACCVSADECGSGQKVWFITVFSPLTSHVIFYVTSMILPYSCACFC